MDYSGPGPTDNEKKNVNGLMVLVGNRDLGNLNSWVVLGCMSVNPAGSCETQAAVPSVITLGSCPFG